MNQESTAALEALPSSVIELSCSTWIGVERLLSRRRIVLPWPTATAAGPVAVAVTLPSLEVLTLDAEVVQVEYDTDGVGGTEISLCPPGDDEWEHVRCCAQRCGSQRAPADGDASERPVRQSGLRLAP